MTCHSYQDQFRPKAYHGFCPPIQCSWIPAILCISGSPSKDIPRLQTYSNLLPSAPAFSELIPTHPLELCSMTLIQSLSLMPTLKPKQSPLTYIIHIHIYLSIYLRVYQFSVLLASFCHNSNYTNNYGFSCFIYFFC